LSYADKFDALYSDLKNKSVKVGDIMELPSGRIFNFADNENYFVVSEKK
jgi:lactoylglutathione lyase